MKNNLADWVDLIANMRKLNMPPETRYENFVDDLKSILIKYKFRLEDSATFYIPELNRTFRVDSSEAEIVKLDR